MFVLRVLLSLLLCWSLTEVAHADGMHITEARLEAHDVGWQLVVDVDFELPQVLEDAVNRGIALYFVAEAEISRPRWYWLDEKVISATQTFRLAYQPLTRQYRISTGGLHLRYASLKEALAVLQRLRAWTVADRNALRIGQTYLVLTRLRLDVTQLPKPFQVNAVNTREWNLASEWKKQVVILSEGGK
jgi:Domain of unknown function (DUF4390)